MTSSEMLNCPTFLGDYGNVGDRDIFHELTRLVGDPDLQLWFRLQSYKSFISRPGPHADKYSYFSF